MARSTKQAPKQTTPVAKPVPTRAEQIADLVDDLYNNMLSAERTAQRRERELAEVVVKHGATRAISEMEYAIKARNEANAWSAVREAISHAFNHVDTFRARLIEFANTGANEGEDPTRYWSKRHRAEINAIVTGCPADERDARTLLVGLESFRRWTIEKATREMSSPSQLRAASIRDTNEVSERAAYATILRDELTWPIMKLNDLFGRELDA